MVAFPSIRRAHFLSLVLASITFINVRQRATHNVRYSRRNGRPLLLTRQTPPPIDTDFPAYGQEPQWSHGRTRRCHIHGSPIARDLQARFPLPPTISLAAALFSFSSSSTSSFARWCLTRIEGGALLHAHFSAYRGIDGYEGAAGPSMDLD
ncbi:hypothetical protein B0H14DRAFT_3505465 [Mycena olivaceomarginata]|nr:hypothetical protein B0H14DRAFT_3505465 [Mycena olivaceomarginata]